MIVGIALGLLCIAAAYRLAGALHNAFWRKQEERYAAAALKTRRVEAARITIPGIFAPTIYSTYIRKQNYARMQTMQPAQPGWEIVGGIARKKDDDGKEEE